MKHKATTNNSQLHFCKHIHVQCGRTLYGYLCTYKVQIIIFLDGFDVPSSNINRRFVKISHRVGNFIIFRQL
jgi:hypothetical protein